MYNARKQSPPFAWISRIPREDQEWARDYLRQRQMYVASDAFEINASDMAHLGEAQARIVDLNLRNAWRQRKARRNLFGKKAYNFILTNKSKKELDKIADDMKTTVTEALTLVIRDERGLRIERKAVEKEARRLKKISDAEVVLRAAENVLALQTMKLAFAQIQLQRPLQPHVPLDAVKDEVLARFSVLWQEAKDSMGALSLGLLPKAPEKFWEKITGEAEPEVPPSGT